MVRATVRLAVSLAVLFTIVLVLQPSPVPAAATVVQQEWGGCWNCSSLNTVDLPKTVTSGDAIVIGILGYYPCPASGCPNQVSLPNLSVGDSRGSTFTQVVAGDMATTSGTMKFFVAIYVATLSSTGSGDFAKITFPYATQELDLYMYEVSGVSTTANIPYSAGTGVGYDVHINNVGYDPGAFLLGIMGTECPPYGTYGQPIDVVPGKGFTLSTYISYPSPGGQCSSLHAEYSTTGAETPSFTTFPATIAGTSTTPSWVEVGIVLNSHTSPISITPLTTSGATASQTGTTDWEVTQVWVNPSPPTEGKPATLGMTGIALSTTGDWPQGISVHCTVDGVSCGSGTVSYPGPTGKTFNITAETLWNAVAGTHTLSWQIDAANDPNPANNMMSVSFTVPTSQSVSTTSFASASSSAQSGTTQLATFVQTVTQQPTSASTQPTVQPGILDMLQQNGLLLIAALGLIVVILAVALIRRGKRPSASTVPSSTPTSFQSKQPLFCINCGAQNQAGDKFCRKCAHELT